MDVRIESSQKYLQEAVGAPLTDALAVLSKEKYLIPSDSFTPRETALAFLAYHLRAYGDKKRSQIYKDKKIEEFEEFVAHCTIAKRLKEMIRKRRDLEGYPEWSQEDEREYVRLCKEFDQSCLLKINMKEGGIMKSGGGDKGGKESGGGGGGKKK